MDQPVGDRNADSSALEVRSFGTVLADLRAVHERVRAFEARLEQAGAPYTPGRMPV